MEPKLTPAIAVETSIELQVLDKVNRLESVLQTISVKLFGDGPVENVKARLPALERAVETLEMRVRRLERVVWLATGGGIVIGWMLHLVVR